MPVDSPDHKPFGAADPRPVTGSIMTRALILVLGLSLSACAGQMAATAKQATGAVGPVANFGVDPSCDQPDVETLAAVIRVATDAGADGSGVVVSHNLVLTAAHVLEDSLYPMVYINQTYRHAALLATDPNADLALLSVDTGELSPMRLSESLLDDAEPVWAVGFPLALGQATTRGEFQSNNNGRLFTSAPIKAGNSGGGLMRCWDGHYELAGMVRGYGAYWKGDQLISLEDELSISVPARRIREFIQTVEISSL